jgi:hypothetical protein
MGALLGEAFEGGPLIGTKALALQHLEVSVAGVNSLDPELVVVPVSIKDGLLLSTS